MESTSAICMVTSVSNSVRRAMTFAVLGLLLQACRSDDAPDTEPDDQTQAMEQCRTYEAVPFWANALPTIDGRNDSAPTTRRGELSGVIEAIVDPSPSDYGLGKAPGDAAYALRVETEEQTLEVALSLPWPEPIARVGETVHVRYAIETVIQFYSYEHGSIEIRDDAGNLLAWVFDGGPSELDPPPELEIEELEGCTYNLIVGPVVRRGLRVTAGDESDDVSIGEVEGVGDFTVLHDDIDQTGIDMSKCADCVADHRITIAVVSTARVNLAAGLAPDEDAGL